MHLLLAFAHQQIKIPFSTINNVSISVKRYRLSVVKISISVKAACHVKPGAAKKLSG